MISPAAFSCPASSAAGVTGPSRRIISTAGDGLRLAVPGWTARATRSSSVAPVCQRIPIRTLAWSGSGSTVTSAIRVRSSRLRSLLAGGRGAPECGQVGGEFLQLGPARQRRQRFAGGLQRLLGLGEEGEPGLPAGLQAPGDQPVFRLAGAEGALGPVGVVTRAFDRKLSRAADPLVRPATSSAAASARATCSGVSASSSTPATASSTVAAATDRQVGVVSRSAREEHS